MTIKGQPKCMHKLIARDELYDAIDLLNRKISQCKESGITADDLQLTISDYLKFHRDYPSITVSGNL